MTAPVLASAFQAAEPVDVAGRDLLRFITCGSVDDGKSTLIGRLLYDNGHLYEDQVASIARDSARVGTQGGGLDLALALDGLTAEREQGITIDVAYRFFSTRRRSFIVADTPGHEQYTRNMATGASTADLAVLLIDARKGLTAQTRRHALLVSMLGVGHVVLAVNKMDLVGLSEERFAAIGAEFRAFATDLAFRDVTAIPMVATRGDNVCAPSDVMPWYVGPTLLDHLETVEVGNRGGSAPFRLAVQWVNRPHSEFRGFSGMVSGAPVRPGQAVTVFPSGERTTVERIVTYDGDLDVAVPGQSVTLTLADEVDVSRGTVMASDRPPSLVNRTDARVFWMGGGPLKAGDEYLVKVGTQLVPAIVDAVRSRVDLQDLSSASADTLGTNDVGDVVLAFDKPVVVEPFAQSRDGGSLILIERESGDTVAMGLVLEDVKTPLAAVADLVASADLPTALAPWLRVPFTSARRSAAKTMTWRLLATGVTVGTAFVLTHDPKIATLLGLGDLLVKGGLYYGHERIWARIGLGLRSIPLPAGR